MKKIIVKIIGYALFLVAATTLFKNLKTEQYILGIISFMACMAWIGVFRLNEDWDKLETWIHK